MQFFGRSQSAGERGAASGNGSGYGYVAVRRGGSGLAIGEAAGRGPASGAGFYYGCGRDDQHLELRCYAARGDRFGRTAVHHRGAADEIRRRMEYGGGARHGHDYGYHRGGNVFSPKPMVFVL